MSDIIFGRNPVMEAIKSKREIEKILVQQGSEGSVKKIEALARQRKINLQYVARPALDRAVRGSQAGSQQGGKANHQGVVAYVSAFTYTQLEEILEKAVFKGEKPFIIILDGIEDPHNLGAIIRSAEGAGAHGLVIPERRSASVTETVAKVSAGALEHIDIAKVQNLADTVDKLKRLGIWIGVSHMEGKNYWEEDFTGPLALIIGSEGKGVSRLLIEKSDFALSIPMMGKVNSLNASNAAAVLLFEIARQRQKL